MVAAHPFLGDGWTQPLSTLTNARNVGLSQGPRRPEGCLLAPQLHHCRTQVGSLSSRTRSKQVTALGEGGRVCFLALWPLARVTWVGPGSSPAGLGSERYLAVSRSRLCGPPPRGRGSRVSASPGDAEGSSGRAWRRLVDDIPANLSAQRQARHAVKGLGDECREGPAGTGASAHAAGAPDVPWNPGAHSPPLCLITVTFVVLTHLTGLVSSGHLGSECKLRGQWGHPGLAGDTPGWQK